MNVELHPGFSRLLRAEPHALAGDSPTAAVRRRVPRDARGVYVLWWNGTASFPSEMTLPLRAGKRGTIDVDFVRPKPIVEVRDAIALYVGKGAIRFRLTSHLKPSELKDGRSGRNPYEWMAAVFGRERVERLYREQVSFGFLEEPCKLEQIYLENLAIGILKPWFNFRIAS